jgi:aromatic ring-opening dioxygenase LigB subunit
MSYAYDPTNKSYDFLTILKELKNEDSSETTTIDTKVVTDSISK